MLEAIVIDKEAPPTMRAMLEAGGYQDRAFFAPYGHGTLDFFFILSNMSKQESEGFSGSLTITAASTPKGLAIFRFNFVGDLSFETPILSNFKDRVELGNAATLYVIDVVSGRKFVVRANRLLGLDPELAKLAQDSIDASMRLGPMETMLEVGEFFEQNGRDWTKVEATRKQEFPR